MNCTLTLLSLTTVNLIFQCTYNAHAVSDSAHWPSFNSLHDWQESSLTTVFVDTQLWKTKHWRKRFQNFRQSCVLSTDRIEIHQSQPLVWPSDLLYVMLAGCVWWILIRSVDNMYDWRKFWKCFRRCFVCLFVFESRVSTKTVVSGNVACMVFICA